MKKIICFTLIACTAVTALTFTACKKKEIKSSEYEIFATYDSESRTLHGTMNFTYYNDTDNEISDLKFNLRISRGERENHRLLRARTRACKPPHGRNWKHGQFRQFLSRAVRVFVRRFYRMSILLLRRPVRIRMCRLLGNFGNTPDIYRGDERKGG